MNWRRHLNGEIGVCSSEDMCIVVVVVVRFIACACMCVYHCCCCLLLSVELLVCEEIECVCHLNLTNEIFVLVRKSMTCTDN